MTAEKYKIPMSVRVSMSAYRQESWLTNVPLYGIKSFLENKRFFSIKQDGELYLQVMLVVRIIFLFFVENRVKSVLFYEEGYCWVVWRGVKQGSSKLQARKPSKRECENA